MCHSLLTFSLTVVLYFSMVGDSVACESVPMSTFRNGHFGSMSPTKQNLPTGTPGFELVASLCLFLFTVNLFLTTD